jgi:hypothetical protein
MLPLALFLAAAAQHSARLDWNWSANSFTATTFSIQRGASAKGPFHQIAKLPLTARSYSDTKVQVRKAPYCYQIVVLGKKKNSAPSPVVCGLVK